MHEFSIARSIVGIAEEEVKRANARSVESIELDIGRLSGIDLHALDFVWDEAVRNSVLNEAEKKVRQIPGIGYCPSCEQEFEIDQLFDMCPICSQYITEVKSGTDLRVMSITFNI